MKKAIHPQFRRLHFGTASGHRWTAPRCIQYATELMKQPGKSLEAQRILNSVGVPTRQDGSSQRQVRKNRRRAWAAGNSAAFTA